MGGVLFFIIFFSKIIVALTKTACLMQQIDAVGVEL
jgi:hypothetical protein